MTALRAKDKLIRGVIKLFDIGYAHLRHSSRDAGGILDLNKLCRTPRVLKQAAVPDAEYVMSAADTVADSPILIATTACSVASCASDVESGCTHVVHRQRDDQLYGIV